MRALKRLALGALLALATALLFLGHLASEDYHAYLAPRRPKLERSRVEGRSEEAGRTISWVELHGSGGIDGECGVLEPRNPNGRHPGILLLGGRASGKRSIENAGEGLPDVVLVALDYSLDGPEPDSLLVALDAAPRARERIFEIPLRAMLATDYLVRREDVDPSRVFVIGYSFGALFVPLLAAEDRRFSEAVLVEGGGGLPSLIRHNLEPWTDKATSAFGGFLGGMLLRPMAPERFAPFVSPVPFLMVNGTKDPRVPRENVDVLYRAAREPKRIVWLPIEHVDPRRPEIIQETVAAVARVLREEGKL